MSAADRFRAAVREHDVARAAQELAEDVQLYNPSAAEPVTGRAAVTGTLTGLGSTFDEFEHVGVLRTDHPDEDERIAETQAVMFRARIGEHIWHGLDVLEVSRDDQIVTFTVYARPLSALRALGEAIAVKRGDA